MRWGERLSDVAEAAFEHLEADDATWLAKVARVLEERVGEGYGCTATMYAPSPTSIGFETVLGPGLPEGLEARKVFEATTQAPPDFTRRVYRDLTCDTASGIDPICERSFQARVHDWGIRDAICINARAGEHTGAGFLIPQPRRRRLRMSERRWLDEVTALLQTAVRKRRSIRPLAAPPSAPDPKTPAVDVVPLPNEATRLEAAGFRPIRELDEDGRRMLVVEPVTLGALASLSSRERAAVLALRPGTTNKDIAALLGATSSTVGVLLHRAAVKLRVRSRSELVAIAMQASQDS